MSNEMPHSISEGKRMVMMLQKRNEELRAALQEARYFISDLHDWVPGWMIEKYDATTGRLDKVLEGE